MSKHSRRTEHVTSTTTRGRMETGLTQKLPDAEPVELSGANATFTPQGDGVGKYWIVIALWSIGFISLIVYELIAAIFRG